MISACQQQLRSAGDQGSIPCQGAEHSHPHCLFVSQSAFCRSEVALHFQPVIRELGEVMRRPLSQDAGNKGGEGYIRRGPADAFCFGSSKCLTFVELFESIEAKDETSSKHMKIFLVHLRGARNLSSWLKNHGLEDWCHTLPVSPDPSTIQIMLSTFTELKVAFFDPSSGSLISHHQSQFRLRSTPAQRSSFDLVR